MVLQRNRGSNSITGTVSKFLPRAGGSVVRPGKDYFLVRISSSQVAFSGSIWERVKSLVVTSEVDLHYSAFGSQPMQGLQLTCEVKMNRSQRLGLAPDLIQLVPAVMSRITISIKFLLDRENRLAQLAGLINDKTFLAGISLAPGAALVAQTIGGLAQKIITTFMPDEDRQPILEFTGDMNLATGELQEGYYVIVGTQDENNPIPGAGSQYEIQESDQQLLIDGSSVTQLSYIAFEVRRAEARTRDQNEGAPWEAKLMEAEQVAGEIADGFYTQDYQKQAAWDRCLGLLRDAHALLLADPNYLLSEAELIYRASFAQCSEAVRPQPLAKGVAPGTSQWQPDEQASRAALGIAPSEDLGPMLNTYAAQVASSREMFKSVGMS